MAICVFARWCKYSGGEQFAFYPVKTAIFNGKSFNILFVDGDKRNNTPVKDIRIVKTDITEPIDKFDDLLFRDLSKDLLMKTIKILGGYDKVVQEKWWGYVRDLLGLRPSTSLSNRLMIKYSKYNKRKRTTGSQTIQQRKKKRKTKFPPIPSMQPIPPIPSKSKGKFNFYTMADHFHYIINC